MSSYLKQFIFWNYIFLCILVQELGGNLSETFGIHTIWVSSVILMVSMVLMWYEKFRI